MNPHKLIWGFLLWIIPLTSSGQRYVSGHITDAGDGEPIPGAGVFIANTTVGTTTDADGNYKLKIPGEGSYRLVISHVAYQPVFRDIETGKASTVLDVAMKTHEMGEVVVSTDVRFRNRDIDLFWRTILGKRPSKETIYATNPETVYYYYNSKTRILKVTCRVPLQIINNETGYQIQYVLNYFIHDYNTQTVSWEGQCMFEELEPKNYRQKSVWEENRKKAHCVSIASFAKALYNNSLMESGFLLTYRGDRIDQKGPPRNLALAIAANFLTSSTADNCKTLYIPSDSTVILTCFGKSVTGKDLGSIKSAQNGRLKWAWIGLYRNRIETPDEPVCIFPDGTFKNTLSLTPQFSSNQLTGINMILPIEYNPSATDMGVFTENTHSPGTLLNPAYRLVNTIDSVAKRFGKQLSIFPQEKIYLHTDKPYYISGERIWFRAHVIDAALHTPVPSVNCIYVELFDSRDSVVCRVKIGPKNDAFHGYVDIPDNIPEGDYTIRAYTNTMHGLEEDQFFMKTIRIGDPMARIIRTIPDFEFVSDKKVNATIRFFRTNSSIPITPETVKITINDGKPAKVNCVEGASAFNFRLPSNEKQRVMLLETQYEKHVYRQYIRIPLPNEDFDVAFFPEGGSALYDCRGRIAFKATQQDGQAIDVAGVVYNQHGKKVCTIKTDVRGMGNFTMAPVRGEKYHAICTDSNGRSKRFDLPAAKGDGYALSATWVKDRLLVTVHQPGPWENKDTLCLIVHSRGMVYDARIWENVGEPIIYHKDIFPSGVMQLMLLTKNMIPVSERLVFMNNDDQAHAVCSTDRENYNPRDSVRYTIGIKDESGEPLMGNFSVSVTDDREVMIDTTANILTTFLLSSDVRGNISDPAFYFRKDTRSAWALELLMLTQGWRRYDAKRIVQNDFIHPVVRPDAGISGKVKKASSRKVARDAEVSIISAKGDYFETATIDQDGRFYFRDIGLPDSTWFIIQAIPQSGVKNIELVLDKEQYLGKKIPANAATPPAGELFARYADKAEQKYIDEHGIRTVHLDEVTISAKKQPVKKSVLYTMADNSITEDQLDKFPANDIYNLLIRLPGVSVSDKKIFIRGQETQLLIVDDAPMDMEDIETINVHDIAQIDVLKNVANTAILGFRGGNGAIVIFTKDGKKSKPIKTPLHVKSIMPLGFQKPAEFYAPKYDTPGVTSKPDLRTTIHWLPSLTTDETGTASFRFYTADAPSTYSVVIEGITDDGRIISKKDKMLVIPTNSEK